MIMKFKSNLILEISDPPTVFSSESLNSLKNAEAFRKETSELFKMFWSKMYNVDSAWLCSHLGYFNVNLLFIELKTI